MKSFKVDKIYSVVCESKNTRSGFKHVATLLYNGREIESVKICYLNRTWERYEYESVLNKILTKVGIISDLKIKNFLDRSQRV